MTAIQILVGSKCYLVDFVFQCLYVLGLSVVCLDVLFYKEVDFAAQQGFQCFGVGSIGKLRCLTSACKYI